MKRASLISRLLGSAACAVAFGAGAMAAEFDIPSGNLAAALDAYSAQSGVPLVVSAKAVRNVQSSGLKGDFSAPVALSRLLRGTGFAANPSPSGVIEIVNVGGKSSSIELPAIELAQATPVSRAAVETVTVTSSKLGGADVQSIPIAITALSQEQLTSRQVAGGPDLIKEVPNLTFSKTNFSGYNIEIRGIGTQAISVTTDPAVAVAFNDIPFLRNHFFEQEFFDVSQVEVLRGPQGTLYGRNATAGVVNVISARPTDQYEAMLSADWGNYLNRRYEGMVNIPVVDDQLDIRVAGEWTKRNGYSFNDVSGQSIDGRDLWSGRATIGWKPTSDIQTYLVWEHFSEDDDRIRSAKQLCSPVPVPTMFGGVPVGLPHVGDSNGNFLSQGCGDGTLYSSSSFGEPDGQTLPLWTGLHSALAFSQDQIAGGNPYAGTTQSTNLRVISSELDPTYKAKNDTLEFNANWQISPVLTFTSQTGYNHDFLWSTEDYNRFTTTPGAIGVTNLPQLPSLNNGSGLFCDPQLGCSNRLEIEDLSDEHAWQFSQEFRLASSFNGPVNFSFGGNYLHYETEENYYVFSNALTLISLAAVIPNPAVPPWQPGVSTDSFCLPQPHQYGPLGSAVVECSYIDPNPLGSLNNQGHNYFLSQNPYLLNSYASFGEVYYNVAKDFKLTFGGRWTEDQKHFIDIPSEIATAGYGYPIAGVTNQQWDALTGRFVADWTPDLSFTDKTLIYFSAAHGYKAGGANPPGAELLRYFSADITNPIHPLTFKPEYIESFELGTKNTTLDGALTLNGDVFYYNYTGYQISRIVDRSAINDNFNAHVEGAEFEANWEPLPGLKFNLAQGFEDARLDKGAQSVDLLDRTGGMPGWSVVRPFYDQASNCILPNYVIFPLAISGGAGLETACGVAYGQHLDPVTAAPYVANPPGVLENPLGVPICPGGPDCGVQYPGFDPLSAPNNGQGFDKNLGGNQLPNAPHFTTSIGADYTMPIAEDWAATLHADFYWQSQSWARVFEDPIDNIHGYSTTNLALILSSTNGWQVMGYVKNVFNVTAITGTFLNSDDTDLTTNIFLTDPRLFGVRVTKQLDEANGFWGSEWTGKDFFTGLFSDADNGKPLLWIELGGGFDIFDDSQEKLNPPFFTKLSKAGFESPLKFEDMPTDGLEESAKISFMPPDSDWVLSASVRYGRNSSKGYRHQQTTTNLGLIPTQPTFDRHRYAETTASNTESHDIFDFMAGKDFGLGSLGLDGTSILSGGLRFAQFRTKSGLAVYSDPDYTLHQGSGLPQKYFHNFSARSQNKASFMGLGPTISWNASAPLSGDTPDRQITFDWGANAAVLFGRQKSEGFHQTNGKLSTGLPLPAFNTTHYTHGPYAHNRSRMVAVPNLGGFAGLSFHYANAKVSFGYRIDEFLGAMDGGIDTYKSYNFGDSGPFVNLTLGLGG